MPVQYSLLIYSMFNPACLSSVDIFVVWRTLSAFHTGGDHHQYFDLLDAALETVSVIRRRPLRRMITKMMMTPTVCFSHLCGESELIDCIIRVRWTSGAFLDFYLLLPAATEKGKPAISVLFFSSVILHTAAQKTHSLSHDCKISHT